MTEYTFEDLSKQTVAQLRKIAEGVEHEALQDPAKMPRSEIPLVVKVPIGGQQPLMNDLKKLTLLENGSRVIANDLALRPLALLVKIYKPHNDGNFLTRRENFLHEHLFVFSQELEVDEKFLIQTIAAQGHFRENHQITFILLCLSDTG